MTVPAVEVGAPVRCTMSKWPDLPHWQFDGRYLGRDETGAWIGVPRGTRHTRPGLEFDGAVDAVTVVPDSGDYLATFHQPGIWVDVYVDITTTPVLADARLRAIDLDLDVVRLPDGTVYVDDEDEFAEHQVSLSYPPAIIESAERSCRAVRDALTAGCPPYDGRGQRWLQELSAVQS